MSKKNKKDNDKIRPNTIDFVLGLKSLNKEDIKKQLSELKYLLSNPSKQEEFNFTEETETIDKPRKESEAYKQSINSIRNTLKK